MEGFSSVWPSPLGGEFSEKARGSKPPTDRGGTRSSESGKGIAQTRFLLLTILAMQSVSADLPLVRLDAIFPPGGQAGTTVEVTVSGADLDGLRDLRFSAPGIVAKPKLDESGGKPVERRFVISVAADTPVGNYDVRVVGRFGVSNPRVFAVGDMPEILETGSNKKLSDAQALPINTTVNGKADERSPDFFGFTGEQGQRLLIRCESERLDTRMNPVLVLYTKEGRELARNRRGDLIDFTVPENGEFVIKVYDSVYGGGEEFGYRLCVSSGPQIDFVYPPVGLPGSTATYSLVGRNLPDSRPSEFLIDGKPLEELDVEIELPEPVGDKVRGKTSLIASPAAVPLDGIEYRYVAEKQGMPRRVSNPFFMGLSKLPIELEQEPNDTPETATSISLPCEFVGRFYPAGDRDWIGFEAKKGEVYSIEVISQRLGLPTNPFVLVQRAKTGKDGKLELSDIKELYDSDLNFGGREFDTRHRDPEWRFEVKEDGAYRIQIRDLFDQATADGRLGFRLVLRKEQPDFRLAVIPQAPDIDGKNEVSQWTPFLRQGDRVPINIVVFRRDGFDQEIELFGEGLPEGITCARVVLGKNENAATLMLSSSETSCGWVGPLRIVGRAKSGESEWIREATGGSVIWNVADYNQEEVHSRRTDDAFAAVSADELAPVEIRALEEKVWENWIGGKMEMPLEVVRRRGFDGEIKFRASREGGFKGVKEFQLAANATNAVVQLDVAELKLAEGAHRFYVMGDVKGKYQKASAEEVALLEASVASSEMNLKELEAEAARLAEELKSANEDGKAAAKARSEETVGKKEKAAEALKIAKQARERARPTDANLRVYSPLIQLRIAKDPIQFAVDPTETQASAGGKTEIPVRIERLFGFDDPVTVMLSPGQDDKGISATAVSISSGKSEAKLPIEVSVNAVPGKHTIVLRAAYRFKDKEVTLEREIELSIRAAEKKAT